MTASPEEQPAQEYKPAQYQVPPQYQMPPQYPVRSSMAAPQTYPAGYWQPSPYQQVQPRRTDGLAVASMVLGIVWVFWIGSILAVIFGHVARRRIAREGTAGRGMATAGLVLGYIGIGTLVLEIVASVILRATNHS